MTADQTTGEEMRETAGKEHAQLGAVQETMFIPLAATGPAGPA